MLSTIASGTPARTAHVLARIFVFSLITLFASEAFCAVSPGPDIYGYTVAATTFDFEDLTEPAIDAPPILGTADDEAVTVPIGFSFVFYGVAYNTVSISSNGMLTFQAADTDWVPVDITTTAPNLDLPSIAVFWQDWTFQYFGSDAVYYATLGPAGNRRLVVQWNAAQSSPASGDDTAFFEVKLFEGSNNIEFHYLDATNTDDANYSNGKNTTVGIRNTTGQTTGKNLQWSFNVPVINDETAIRFVAPTFKVNSITRLTTNRHIVLQCKGVPSSVNRIEARTDMKTGSFSLLGSATANSSGIFQYEDVNAASFTQRFYRVAIP